MPSSPGTRELMIRSFFVSLFSCTCSLFPSILFLSFYSVSVIFVSSRLHVRIREWGSCGRSLPLSKGRLSLERNMSGALSLSLSRCEHILSQFGSFSQCFDTSLVPPFFCFATVLSHVDIPTIVYAFLQSVKKHFCAFYKVTPSKLKG